MKSLKGKLHIGMSSLFLRMTQMKLARDEIKAKNQRNNLMKSECNLQWKGVKQIK